MYVSIKIFHGIFKSNKRWKNRLRRHPVWMRLFIKALISSYYVALSHALSLERANNFRNKVQNVATWDIIRIIIRHYLCSNRGVKVQFFQFFALSGTGRVQRDSHGRKSEDPCVTTTAKAVPFESFAFHFESRATPRNRQS